MREFARECGRERRLSTIHPAVMAADWSCFLLLFFRKRIYYIISVSFSHRRINGASHGLKWWHKQFVFYMDIHTGFWLCGENKGIKMRKPYEPVLVHFDNQ